VDLPCSVGVGPTKSVAKLLSDRAKPDGLLHWPADEVVARLRPLPVGDLWGAGPKTVERLTSFGFRTVGQLADAELRTLQRVVGEALGTQLHQLARGVDPRRVTPSEPARSISASAPSTTTSTTPDELERQVLRLSETVGRRLRASQVAGRTITLKVRFDTFETVTRSSTLPAPTDRTRDVATIALDLLAGLRLERARVRLLGVGVSNLGEGDGARQLTLDDRRRGGPEPQGHRTARRPPVGAGGADRRLGGERFQGVGVSYAALLDDQDDPAEVAPRREDRGLHDPTPPGEPGAPGPPGRPGDRRSPPGAAASSQQRQEPHPGAVSTTAVEVIGQLLVHRVTDHQPQLDLHGSVDRVPADEGHVVVQAPPTELGAAIAPVAPLVGRDRVDLQGAPVVGGQLLDRAVQRDLPAHRRLVGGVVLPVSVGEVVQRAPDTAGEPVRLAKMQPPSTTRVSTSPSSSVVSTPSASAVAWNCMVVGSSRSATRRVKRGRIVVVVEVRPVHAAADGGVLGAGVHTLAPAAVDAG
jgi:hypothetical protein